MKKFSIAELWFVITVMLIALFCVRAFAADDDTEYAERVQDQASCRVPPATVRGVTNQRFQWPPGYLDVPIYLVKHYILKEPDTSKTPDKKPKKK